MVMNPYAILPSSCPHFIANLLPGIEHENIVHGGFFQVDGRYLDPGIPEGVDDPRQHLRPVLIDHEKESLCFYLNIPEGRLAFQQPDSCSIIIGLKVDDVAAE